MKMHFATIAVALLLSSYHPTHAQTSVPTNESAVHANEDRNKQVAINYVNSFYAGNAEAALANFAQDAVFMEANNPNASNGIEAIKKRITNSQQMNKAAFPDMKVEIISAMSDGDKAMVAYKTTGSWKGDVLFMKASGRPFNLNDVYLFTFNDEGKITALQNILPQSGMMEQIEEGAELSINSKGYQLMAEGKMNEAIELFKANVGLYPKSSNVYDSLGEAYAKAGNKKEAIKNYEKSIQLDPNNKNGIKALEDLKAK